MATCFASSAPSARGGRRRARPTLSASPPSRSQVRRPRGPCACHHAQARPQILADVPARPGRPRLGASRSLSRCEGSSCSAVDSAHESWTRADCRAAPAQLGGTVRSLAPLRNLEGVRDRAELLLQCTCRCRRVCGLRRSVSGGRTLGSTRHRAPAAPCRRGFRNFSFVWTCSSPRCSETWRVLGNRGVLQRASYRTLRPRDHSFSYSHDACSLFYMYVLALD